MFKVLGLRFVYSQPEESSCSVVWQYSSRHLCISCQMQNLPVLDSTGTMPVCDISSQDAFENNIVKRNNDAVVLLHRAQIQDFTCSDRQS